MNCDAVNIGEKTFSIQIKNATQKFEMNMSCQENAYELGIENGSLFQSQEKSQVRNGFAIQIQANISVQAKLGMEMTQGEAERASWAYFDEDAEVWVTVESEYVDGELVCETDHFSIWTIAEINTISAGFWTIIGVGVFSIVALAAILIRKKKVQVVQ